MVSIPGGYEHASLRTHRERRPAARHRLSRRSHHAGLRRPMFQQITKPSLVSNVRRVFFPRNVLNHVGCPTPSPSASPPRRFIFLRPFPAHSSRGLNSVIQFSGMKPSRRRFPVKMNTRVSSARSPDCRQHLSWRVSCSSCAFRA